MSIRGKSDKKRIAIVNADRCKPKKCQQECKKVCPVVRIGKLCVQADYESAVAYLAEDMCIGCGLCVQKCPFEALAIINLPKSLENETTHRYGPNAFMLHRMPVPRAGQVLGLVGVNGVGKSTVLNILSGKIKANLGRFQDQPTWHEIEAYFKGSTLQSYFKSLVENNLKTVIKPQYVDQLPKSLRGTVKDYLKTEIESSKFDSLAEMFDLKPILEKKIETLSGGELQRFACSVACMKERDIYMFDEPSSYLDVKQRIKAATAIRSLVRPDNYVIVVEHDLAILDFLSDYVNLLYGSPGHYGVVSAPSSVANGINHFMDGFIPSENLRFRDYSLSFDLSEKDEEILSVNHYNYPSMVKRFDHFELKVDAGQFTDSEILVLFGENGTGKTTFIRMLAGNLEPDNDSEAAVPKLNVSYKPQKLSPKFRGTVKDLLTSRILDAFVHAQFKTDVLKPLNIENIIDRDVITLSGGELQRVALTLCLGKPADIYLIDEPSAYLDAEQRVNAARVIKRFVRNAKKTAFVVEHDFIMATYLADRVIVFEGQPSVSASCTPPQSLLTGINYFLKLLNVTFRRDRNNHRPRINKLNGFKDVEQKQAGKYFMLD